MSFNGTAWAAIGAGGGTDANAVHVNVGAEIAAITAKATPTTSDIILIEDAADLNKKKKITIGDLPGGGGNTIYTANDTIGTGRVATLTDTLDFYEGTFNLFGLDKAKKIVFIGGDSNFGNQTTYVNNALNLKYNTSNGRGQIYAIDSVGNQGKLNLKGSEVEIESIKTNDQFILGAGANGNQQGATRSIEYKFNDDYTWKGINLLSTLTYPTAKFEIQPSPNGVGGTYDTAFRVNGNKTVDVLGLDTLATSSAFRIYDGDGTPNLLWDFRNNGDVHINQDSVLKTNNFLTFDLSDATSGRKLTIQQVNIAPGVTLDPKVDFETNGGINIVSNQNTKAINVADSVTGVSFFKVPGRESQDAHAYWHGGTKSIGQGSNNVSIEYNSLSIDIYDNGSNYLHKFGLGGGGNNHTEFFRSGFTTRKLIIGSSSLIGTEDISLQGDTLLNANVNMPNLPTSSTGLVSGDLYNDGGTVKIV